MGIEHGTLWIFVKLLPTIVDPQMYCDMVFFYYYVSNSRKKQYFSHFYLQKIICIKSNIYKLT
jgi:hypothetical protein